MGSLRKLKSYNERKCFWLEVEIGNLIVLIGLTLIILSLENDD